MGDHHEVDRLRQQAQRERELAKQVAAIVHEVLAAPRFGGKSFQSEVNTGAKDFTSPDWVASVEVVKSLEKFMPKNVTGVAVTDAQTRNVLAILPGDFYLNNRISAYSAQPASENRRPW